MNQLRRPSHSAQKGNQGQPKAAKPARAIVAAPQSARIVGRFIAGEFLRSIARAEHRDRSTITRIVRGPEVAQYVSELRSKFFGALEFAMQTLLEEIGNPNNKDRGRLAFDMLKAGGIVPTPQQLDSLLAEAVTKQERTEEEAVLKIVSGLLEAAHQRQVAYQLDDSELEADLRKAGGRFSLAGKIEPFNTED